MITGIACFIAGLFFDHFYPVPAKLVRDKVVAGIAAARKVFVKEPTE